MGAKTDVVVKLALVFFISLLSFSIGTFVGKKYSDNQHKLAALEPERAERGQNSHEGASASREVASETKEAPAAATTATTAAAGTETAAVKPGENMTDEEIAKLAEEFVADDTTATNGKKEEHGGAMTAAGEGTKEAAKGETAAAPKTRTLEKAEPLSVAKNIVRGKAPGAAVSEEPKAETRVPSSVPKDVAQYSSGKFTVQVGAYAKEDEAQKIAGGLKAKGFSAFYVPATIKGQTWYRVSVGLFATPKEAQEYRSELMSKAKISSALVQKIVQ